MFTQRCLPAAGPYGATTIAGPRGELQPTPGDLAIAKALGGRVAEVTAQVRGNK